MRRVSGNVVFLDAPRPSDFEIKTQVARLEQLGVIVNVMQGGERLRIMGGLRFEDHGGIRSYSEAFSLMHIPDEHTFFVGVTWLAEHPHLATLTECFDWLVKAYEART